MISLLLTRNQYRRPSLFNILRQGHQEQFDLVSSPLPMEQPLPAGDALIRIVLDVLKVAYIGAGLILMMHSGNI